MYTYEIFPLHLPGMNYRIHTCSTIFFPQVYIETEKFESIWVLLKILQQQARKFTVSGIKEWSNIPLFISVCLMNIWFHFLRNRLCAKKSITRWCDDAITMVRWRDTDGAREHRFIASHRIIAPSSSHHRYRTVVPSRHCHRTIASATQTRWCYGVNCVALSGFHTFKEVHNRYANIFL